MHDVLLWVTALAVVIATGWGVLAPSHRAPGRQAGHDTRRDTRRARNWRRHERTKLLSIRPAGPLWQARPAPGDIWLADLLYDGGPERRARACLILRSALGHVEALTITSQSQAGQPNFVEIPTRAWNPEARYNHFLELSTPTALPDELLGSRAGRIDAHTWSRISRLHLTGYLYRSGDLPGDMPGDLPGGQNAVSR